MAVIDTWRAVQQIKIAEILPVVAGGRDARGIKAPK